MTTKPGDKIQAQTSLREISKIDKIKAYTKIKNHKQGKYVWVADNRTVFTFKTKKKMERFKKYYLEKNNKIRKVM